jgi:gamma-glutamyltranspeptidase
LKRPKLATTLQKIQDSGITEFYNGSLATNIVTEISNAKGIIGLEDLSGYRYIMLHLLCNRLNNNILISIMYQV